MTVTTAMFESKPVPNAHILQCNRPIYPREMIDSGAGKYKMNLKHLVIAGSKELIRKRKVRQEN